MTQEESVIFGLQELIQAEYNTILSKSNKKHNDGIIIEEITGCNIESDKGLRPFISIHKLEEENKTKDRIIDTISYRVNLTIHEKESIHDSWRTRARYVEAVQELVRTNMVNEGVWEYASVRGCKNNVIEVEIIV
jgi:hypothetical protein